MTTVTLTDAKHVVSMLENVMQGRPSIWASLKYMASGARLPSDLHEPTPLLTDLTNALVRARDWSSKQVMCKAMRRVYVAGLGSAYELNQVQFVHRVVGLVTGTFIPDLLLAYVKDYFILNKDRDPRYQPDEIETALLAATEQCAQGATKADLDAVARLVGVWEQPKHDSAHDALTYAAKALELVALANAAFAAASRDPGRRVTEEFASLDNVFAAAAREAVLNAFYAVRECAHFNNTKDATLGAFAEGVVGILRDLHSPGSQWVDIAAPRQ